MSGWIKVDKDLITNPRFKRMCRGASRLLGNDVTQVRYSDEMSVTLVLGCLTKLWIYADTHARDDDTLDLSKTEVDELVGMTGFADLLPLAWLEVVDDQCVKLPGFQEHNGTEAKKKAQTQKRVKNFREREKEQKPPPAVTHQRYSSNAPALPDQTRPDHTRQDLLPTSINQNSSSFSADEIFEVEGSPEENRARLRRLVGGLAQAKRVT